MLHKTYIYSIFLPRTELFFIEEWARHHFNLGIKKIYLYHNGFKPLDTSLIGNNHTIKKRENEDYKWAKKPLDDYNLQLSDEEIDSTLQKIEDKFSGRLHIKYWHPNKAGPYPASQLLGYKELRGNLQKIRKSSWHLHHPPVRWLIIDVDEFLMLHKSDNIQGLIERYRNYGSIHIKSKVFAARQNGKRVRSIYQWGYESKLCKTIVVNKGTPRIKAHLSRSRVIKNSIEIQRRDAEIFHYRGPPWSGNAIFREFPDQQLANKMKKYGPTEENIKACDEIFSNLDFSMKKYLLS